MVLEGIEGAGKTTQVERLRSFLESRGTPVAAVREPGGTSTGDSVRQILLDPGRILDARTEALLFMASRAQLVAEVILPALRDEVVVLADRFFLSTYAYQVVGRGLPADDIRAANRLATQGLVPDVTLLLDLPLEEGLRRAHARGLADRMERSGIDFHRRVAEAFRSFVAEEWQKEHPEAGPVVRVDALGTPDEVAERIVAALAMRWPRTFGPARVSH